MKFEGLLLCLFLGPVLPLDPSKERSLQELGEGEGESGNKSVHFRSQGLKVQGPFVPYQILNFAASVHQNATILVFIKS